MFAVDPEASGPISAGVGSDLATLKLLQLTLLATHLSVSHPVWGAHDRRSSTWGDGSWAPGEHGPCPWLRRVPWHGGQYPAPPSGEVGTDGPRGSRQGLNVSILS